MRGEKYFHVRMSLKDFLASTYLNDKYFENTFYNPLRHKQVSMR